MKNHLKVLMLVLGLLLPFSMARAEVSHLKTQFMSDEETAQQEEDVPADEAAEPDDQYTDNSVEDQQDDRNQDIYTPEEPEQDVDTPQDEPQDESEPEQEDNPPEDGQDDSNSDEPEDNDYYQDAADEA